MVGRSEEAGSPMALMVGLQTFMEMSRVDGLVPAVS